MGLLRTLVGTNGTNALDFLHDVASSGLGLAMVATVPDIIKPALPDVIDGSGGGSGGRQQLAIAKPTSVLAEGLGQWESDDGNAAPGCGTCPPPGGNESLPAGCTECVQPSPTADAVAAKLLAIPKGEITYIYSASRCSLSLLVARLLTHCLNALVIDHSPP
jgi:hypothetical protein